MLLFLRQLFMMRMHVCVCVRACIRVCVRACVCVVHLYCSAQLSMFDMEKHYRNKIIIIIIIIILPARVFLWVGWLSVETGAPQTKRLRIEICEK